MGDAFARVVIASWLTSTGLTHGRVPWVRVPAFIIAQKDLDEARRVDNLGLPILEAGGDLCEEWWW